MFDWESKEIGGGRGYLHPSPYFWLYLTPWYKFLSLPSLPLPLKPNMVVISFANKVLSTCLPELHLFYELVYQWRVFTGKHSSSKIPHECVLVFLWTLFHEAPWWLYLHHLCFWTQQYLGKRKNTGKIYRNLLIIKLLQYHQWYNAIISFILKCSTFL